MNEKQRVALLGGLAFLMIAFLAVKTFKGSASDDEGSPVVRRERPDVSVVWSGSTPHDHSALAKLYQEIVDAEPFRVVDFSRVRKRGGRAGPRSAGDDTVATVTTNYDTPPPGGIWLRLTGILNDGVSMAAVLEDRASGRVLFTHPGERYGDDLIAAVTSRVVKVEIAPGPTPAGTAPVETRTKTLEPGDRLDFKLADVESRLRTPAFVSSAATAAISSHGVPDLDPEQAKSILERLKERARKSRGQ